VPDPATLLVFGAAALALIVVPGPAVLYIVSQSIDRGRLAGFVSALGIAVGALVHVCAAAVGLSSILVSSATAFNVVKYAGAAYLVCMGLWTILRRRDDQPASAPSERRLRRRFGQGVIVNVLNPKTALFFFAFLPQFVSAQEAHPLARMLELSAVFMLLTFVVFVGYGLFAAAIRNHVVSRPRVLTWMRRTFAAAFVALGAKLALAER
jgi:threonine/homoserine/homoserine lactone efflux protein